MASSHCARLTPPQNSTTPLQPDIKPPDRQHLLGRFKWGVTAQRPESTSQTTSGKHNVLSRFSQRRERKNPDLDDHQSRVGTNEDDAACARMKSVGLPTSLHTQRYFNSSRPWPWRRMSRLLSKEDRLCSFRLVLDLLLVARQWDLPQETLTSLLRRAPVWRVHPQ